MEGASVATRTRMSRDGRRQAIFDETIKVLSERGYHGFNLNELAKRCGLTYAGLLHHFPSKEALLVALLRERDRLDERAVAAALGPDMAGCPHTLTACLSSFRAIVARNAAQPELVRLYAILQAEALVPDHPAFDFFRARDMGIIAIFRDLVADIVPAPLATARQILALMHGMEMQWLRESGSFDLVAEWDDAARKILTSAA